ncbi:MAG TPA: class I SAM-dependent methyltransferase [Pyrinomonadaceae bacterium]
MNEDLQSSYDRVAKEYADEFRDELSHKPFDRKMLDWLIEKVGALGIICDMGCGPGQAAGYLSEQGAPACGIDLSAAMVERAQGLHPGIRFEQGDMLALSGVADNSFGGIAAFYSLVHVPRPLLLQALQELKRALLPQGTLLLTFHLGQQVVHRDEWWGKEVSLDFIFFESAEMKDYLRTAGFELCEAIERDPYPDVEYQSRRGYIFARKP